MRALAACLLVLLLVVPTAAQVPEKFILHPAPQAVRAVQFADGEGKPRTLADFAGKTVLLNIWATWCVSCREEMPTLDRLQAKLGGPDFDVVALSIDRAGPEAVREFYGRFGIRNLVLYIDQTGKANRTLGLVGLPTTLLIDSDGREIGRLIGPAEWDAPEMVAFLKSRIGNEVKGTSP